MTYVRKTRDEFHLFVNYGQGWEYETAEETRAAIRERYKEYRDNCQQSPARWRKVRVRIEEEA